MSLSPIVRNRYSPPFPSEVNMPKPSRWSAEKRFEIIREVLNGKESISQIARKNQVSDALIHRWRKKFFEGGKAALSFEHNGITGSERQSLERQIEELQKVIGEQVLEIRSLKKLARD